MTILCTIDLETREVSLPAGQVIASYDHNVDVIRFQAETIPGFSLNTSSIKIAAQGPNKVRHDYAVDPSTVAIEEETGYITFDWPIPQGVTEMPIGSGFKYGDKGQLIFAVCAEIISGNTVSKAWHSDDGIIAVVAHLEPEAGGGEDPSETATNAQKIGQLQTDVAVINTQVGALGNGSPAPVATVAEMTDESAVYLYTGSETGYTAGNWYFWNGTEWTSGGTYGGAVTDTTLSISGRPADAKAVGDSIGDLSQLTTTAKDNLVAAINEANEAVTGLNGRLARLNDMTADAVTLSTEWGKGSIGTGGVDIDSNSRVRSPYIDVSDIEEISFGISDGYKYAVWKFDSEKAVIETGAWSTSESTYAVIGSVKFIRLLVAKEPDENSATPSWGNELTATLSYSSPLLSKITENSDAINLTPSAFMEDGEWELGTIDGNGQPSGGNSRIRSKDYIDISQHPYLYISIDSGFKYHGYWYNSEHECIGTPFGGWQMGETVLKTANVAYIKFLLAYEPDKNMSNTDISQHLHILADSILSGTINNLSKDVNALSGTRLFSDATWKRGTLDQNGQEASSTSRIVTNDYIDVSNITAILFNVNPGYKYGIYSYDSEHNAIETTGWRYSSNIYMVPSSATYIKLMMAKEPDAWLADASISSNLMAYDKSEYSGLAGGAENGNLEELNWFNATAVNKAEIPALDSSTTILALGDSITAATDETGWIYHFVNMTGCVVNNRAIGGTSYGESATSDSGHWMMTQIGNVSSAMWESADLVIMSCGTNDYGHGTPLAELKTKVQECITAVKAKTSAPIVVITPIRRGTGLNSDPMLKLPVFAGIISSVALSNQCNVICGFSIPLPAYATGYVDSMTQDNLHPNAIGANVYARSVINALM